MTGRNGRWWPGLVAAALVLLLAGCARQLPEQRLRAQLSAMQEALEQRRAGDFIDGVASDFTGNG